VPVACGDADANSHLFAPARIRYVLYMFQSISLREAFERAAMPTDWDEFSQLAEANDVDLWIISMSERMTPYERRVMRYRELWERFVGAVRSKLLSGEWVADGFDPRFGPRPVQIDPRLWKVLDIAISRDEAEGDGFRFTNLSFTEVQAGQTNAAKPRFKFELIRWIEGLAAATSTPMTFEQVRDAARRAFIDVTFSNNMFLEAWRAAEKPPHFLHKGRPKA
jgi:hypothetical protein